ncbi:sensor histidine kinase [Streptomyces sp. CB01580]|uniref:sensor histidine kinase n=1 Tax=Streptomyces sp. CB01580 TaxID=1703933 RepID=UPI00093EC093|nr:nitrate- and nitrite sensing domain-containing protein [Streptomyces sp. CB01580]OKJ43880.1 histidine kinase [Streptomyces sp. CB01580]
MQKKRPRSKGGKNSGSGVTPPAPAESASTRRAVRVRSRLVAGVALVGVTVIAAGAPAILGASADLNESQRLVTLAELNQQAIALAHALADERDDAVARIAAGRDGKSGEKKGGSGARVDRQVNEIRPAAPAALRRDLATIPSLRRDVLGGKGTVLEAHQAYSEIIARLHDVAAELTEKTPPRAADATRAPLALGRATEQASATRGLLVAALSVPRADTVPQIDPVTGLPVQDQDGGGGKDGRTRDELSAAAQQARVAELASLADFDQSAGSATRDKLSTTVTGPEVSKAEKYLDSLTDRPELSESEQRTSAKKVEEALSARVDRMRGVESALGTEQVRRLEQLRDDDVTALELRIALLGGCLLIAVGVSTAVARTLTQPLAVLRIGAARLAAEPATAEPIRYKGRNDEFAQVVQSVNALHGRLRALHGEHDGRVESLQAERSELIAGREALTRQRAELQVLTTDLTAQLERLRDTVDHTFVNLSLRTLGLVERQLGVIESLEEREDDPERLATLFKLDHMATVMRRHSENMLVLAGAEHGHGHANPIPLVDVARAAVSEIERYERVTIQALPPHAQIAGFAADDLSHLVAELLENATSFSPPDSRVQLSGWLLETGEVMLSVQDEGIGMSAERIADLNTRLADPALFDSTGRDDKGMPDAGLGLHVTALLAARHGVRVQLRDHTGSGITAVVVLPTSLLPKAPPVATPTPVKVAGDGPGLNLPGSVAEANSNALPTRTTPGEQGDDPLPGRTTPGQPGDDPLIAAAERAIRAAEPAPGPDHAVGHTAERGTDHPADRSADRTPAPEAPAVPGPQDPAPAPAAEAVEAESEITMQVRLPAAPEATDAPATTAPDPYLTINDPYGVGADPYAAGAAPVPAPAAADADAYAIGPDRHERTTDGAPEPYAPTGTPEPHAAPAPAPAAETVPAPRRPEQPQPHQETVTDKGLPKRTPRVVKPSTEQTTERKGSLDKDALRRRLGGFHQGAKDGRRDVEAELATAPATGSFPGTAVPAGRTPHTDHSEPADRINDRTDETGDTVEEARS